MILDYEQKYKEALERARDMMSYKEVRREDMEYLFPELKESEEEKIRKVLVGFFKSYKEQGTCGSETFNGIPTENILAWLEKQKDNKDIHLLELKAKAYDDAKERMSYAYNQNRVPIGFINEIFPDIMLYEKQCKPKDSNSIYPHFGKPTDKVEPKFHEGDFIKHNKANIICKVILVNSVYYDVENIETRAESELFYAKENFHLWTIKDAKDGDVLRLGDVIAIFKKYIGQEKCICYCSFCDKGGFEIPIENGEDNVYGCTNTTPATKEERDLLFQKMKKDGYEWDADEKVLNKVIIYEQK